MPEKRTVLVYKFNELSEKAQTVAINGFINFMMDIGYESLSPAMKKAVDKAESMRTPWFIGSYIWEYAKDEVLDGVKQYEYHKNGEVFTEK